MQPEQKEGLEKSKSQTVQGFEADNSICPLVATVAKIK